MTVVNSHFPSNEPRRTGAASTLDAGRRWDWYFTLLHTAHVQRAGALFRRLMAARRFLDAHVDELICLDDAARQAKLSKFHFLRIFKAAFHETPIAYQRRRRMEKAQELLVSTDLPVTDICFRVGFESLGSFSSMFRRLVGAPPMEFRRRSVVVPRTIIAPERLIPCCWLQRYAAISN